MCFAIALIPIGVITGLQNFQIATIILFLIVAVTFIVSYVSSYFITKPLVTLTKNIDEISKGNLEIQLEKSEIYEINNLMMSLDRVMASLKLAIHKVGVKKEEIFEEALRAKEELELKYETLLKKIDGWIWETNERGICTKCSPKITDSLGLPPSQVTGIEFLRFFPPDDAACILSLIDKIKKEKNETTMKVDAFWLNVNQRPIWIRTYIIPVFDKQYHFQGLRCFSRDIHDYKISLDKIHELQQQLQDMSTPLQSSNSNHLDEQTLPLATTETFDYMFVFDENAKIVECTENIHKKLGYEKEEMLSLTLLDFKCLETLDDIKQQINLVKQQGTMQLKTIHKKKNGEPVFVSEHIKYLKERNMFVCLVKEDFSPKDISAPPPS